MNDYVSMYNHARDLILKGDLSQAEKIFLHIIKKNPKEYNSLINLGSIYLKKGTFNKSLKYYFAASNIIKNDIVYNGLGNAYYCNKNYKESQKFFLKAIKANSSNINSILNLANLYFVLKKFKLSKKYYLKFYKTNSENIIFYRNIAKINHEIGLYSETIIYFKQALRKNPNNLYLQFLYLNLFPKIHLSRYTKKRLIVRFQLILNRLIKDKEKFNVNDNDIIEIFTSSTNFYLAYCKNFNKEIFKQYFSFISFFLNKIYIYESKKINNLKKKIVIISSYFYNHTVSRLFKNFYKKLNEKFDVSVLYLGTKVDNLTLEIKKHSKEFVNNSDLNFCIKYLKKNNFDIAYFPEIGMSLKTQLLASLRFAKTQIVSWGHPITTGSSSIDYFISSELMEVSDSEKSYNENLIKLKDIGVDLDPRIFPSLERLKTNKKRYKIINLQSLFKILPEDYDFYFKIIKKIPYIKFFFIRDTSDFINNQFFLNFKTNFNNYFKSTLVFENYFFFVNRMKRKDFLKNLINYDLSIDTLDWAGGNSSIESLMCELPVVTLPSETMRSRHTFAFLKHMDLNYLIASDENDLITKIEKLINNDDVYWNIIQEIKINKSKLFISKSFNSLQNFIEDC